MSNAICVRKYYRANRRNVCYRKAIKRCRERGAVPKMESMLEHNISLTTLTLAFAEWVSHEDSLSKIKRQLNKFARLRGSINAVPRHLLPHHLLTPQ